MNFQFNNSSLSNRSDNSSFNEKKKNFNENNKFYKSIFILKI